MIFNVKAVNAIITYFEQKIFQLKVNINKVKFYAYIVEQKIIYTNIKKEKPINIKNLKQLKKHIKLKEYL